MAVVDPHVILRVGSHSEKEYVEKTASRLDGIIVGANLVEATPGATASLLGKRLRRPFYVDPMTYAFGCDIDWIKSEQRRKKEGEVETVVDFKRSYRILAERLGEVFKQVIERGRPVDPEGLADAALAEGTCEGVVEYQLRRIREEFEKDDEYREYAGDVQVPSAVLAPYFHIGGSNRRAWLDLVLRLARISAGLGVEVPVHAVICAGVDALGDDGFLEQVRTELPNTGVHGVWLRFMSFSEYDATLEQLRAFRGLVAQLSRDVEVYNMNGGYFSLVLCKYGLGGVSHGVGYGEQKQLQPIIGAATPTVRYYLPAVHRRFGVPALEICFDHLKVRTPEDFHEQVCDCVVCRGVVKEGIADFRAFGDKRHARSSSKRKSQTPAAAKRCRFHYLVNRIRERDVLKDLSIGDVVARLDASEEKWGVQVSIENECKHLGRWRQALE